MVLRIVFPWFASRPKHKRFEASRKYSPALASDSKYKELQDVVWTFVSGLRMRITGCIPGREYTIKTWHHDISAQECHPHHSAYLRDYVIPNKLWRVQVTGAKGSKTYIETPSRAGAKVGTNGEDDLFAVEVSNIFFFCEFLQSSIYLDGNISNSFPKC